MQTANSFFKWSILISGAAAMAMVGGAFTAWLMIELLVFLTSIAA